MHVHVALSSDDNYAQHLTVTLYSLLINVSAQNFYHLHVLDGGITVQNKEKILASLKKFSNQEIKFYQIDKSVFKNSQKILHINEMSYFRILLPKILTKLEKVLYLDSDLLIFKDVAEIFKINLKENEFLAASQIFHPNYQKVLSKQFKASLFLCFNAGVLLMNLQAMKKDNSTKKLMDFSRINASKLLAADQDVFNIVMANQIKKLDSAWNVGSYVFYAKDHSYCQLNVKKFEQLKHDPGIIHFDGAKPWSFGHFHPYKKKYFQILDQTAFKFWRPKFNLKSLVVNYSFYLATQIMNLLPNKIYKIVETYYLKNNFLEKRYRESNL